MRYVITGTSRGIGLELARQVLARGNVVEAAARRPEASEGLSALAAEHGGALRRHACDVRSDESVRAFAEAIAPGSIDVLVNNAGVMGKLQALAELDFADVLATLDANAVGPLRVTRALLDHTGRDWPW